MRRGFTIVELLVVIVVIGILAALVTVSVSGAQAKARNMKRITDIKSVAKAIELYKADNGSYPITGATNAEVLTDLNCRVGSQSTEWVPGLAPKYIASMPQSDGVEPHGANSGCYKYWSNGVYYIVSAWDAHEGKPQETDGFYRRTGFRELIYGSAERYLCNHINIGGNSDNTYDANQDYYKRSYSIASMPAANSSGDNPCDETPPAGA